MIVIGVRFLSDVNIRRNALRRHRRTSLLPLLLPLLYHECYYFAGGRRNYALVVFTRSDFRTVLYNMCVVFSYDNKPTLVCLELSVYRFTVWKYREETAPCSDRSRFLHAYIQSGDDGTKQVKLIGWRGVGYVDQKPHYFDIIRRG